LREQEAAERRERLAVAAAANKRLFEEDTTLRDTVTVNGNGIDNSTKIVSSKNPPNYQNSTCTVKTDTSSTSSSIQTKLGLANDDLRLRKPNGNGKKINRLSLMSDIELPDYGVQTDLSIDIEKGIFLRKKNSNLTDNESNDSGNNSMNTNGSVGSSNSSHSNSRGKEDRLETHIESEIPGEEEDNSQINPTSDSVKTTSTKIVVSNERNQISKSSNSKQNQNKTSSPLVSTSKTSSKALSPTKKIRDRNTDIASGNSSKNSSPRHAHGRRGSTDDQRRAGAIASLGGITSHNGSPVIKKSLQQSPTEDHPRQRRAKSSQPSIAPPQHQAQSNRRTHMPAGLQVTHV